MSQEAKAQALREAAAEQRRLAADARTSNGQAEHEDIADWLEERAGQLVAEGGERDDAGPGLVTSDEQGLGTCSPEPTRPTDTRAYLREKYREELTEWWAEQVAEHYASPVVTDEAVEAAARAVSVDWQNFAASMRIALEAAVPLLGTRPLLDQQAVADVVYSSVRDQAGPAVASLVGTDVLGRLMELARPMPTQQQLERAILEHILVDPEGFITTDDRELITGAAEAVLALLKGGQS